MVSANPINIFIYIFQEQILQFMQDVFSFTQVRYTTVEQLSDDILRLSKDRLARISQRLASWPSLSEVSSPSSYESCWMCIKHEGSVQNQVIFNTLRPRQHGRYFADDYFKRIFLNENIGMSIKISLEFVHKGPINNNPALVQIMAWRRSGDKALSEPVMVCLLTHICVTPPQWVNTLRSEQNGQYFADDIF